MTMSSSKASAGGAERPLSSVAGAAGRASGGMDRFDEIPHIEHRLAAGIEIFVNPVRRTQNHDIALRHQFIQWLQIRVVFHQGIGGYDTFCVMQESMFELVAEGGADIVDLRLECHSKQPDRRVCKIVCLA